MGYLNLALGLMLAVLGFQFTNLYLENTGVKMTPEAAYRSIAIKTKDINDRMLSDMLANMPDHRDKLEDIQGSK